MHQGEIPHAISLSKTVVIGRLSVIPAIRACGVDEVVALEFTPELAALSPDEFAERHLMSGGVRSRVCCGENWRFGAGGTGDAGFLRRLGYDVCVVPSACQDGETVSSTSIRAALEAGQLEKATAMLGRPFRLAGSVTAGKGFGRTIGFPTVNVVPDECAGGERVRLPRGVYQVSVDGARAIANFGVAPTAGDSAWSKPVLEIHFLDALPLSLQGVDAPRRLSAELLRFVRPERKFRDFSDLQRQIAADCGIMCA